MKEEFKCEECGKKNCDSLYAATKNRDRNDEDFFVCAKCFKKLEGVCFEDFHAEEAVNG